MAAGRRRFTLVPPDQVANLYVGLLELAPAGDPATDPPPTLPGVLGEADADGFDRMRVALLRDFSRSS